MSKTLETCEFKTETRQLLDLMVHSIYSNKDIFLRELISNSSDALDKMRFEAVSQPELLDADKELHILIDVDKDARTISVQDNGIGMSREEVQNLIGTIAKSGTSEFLEHLKKQKSGDSSVELIGQFGVGFYSTFMVGDEVTLLTRRADEQSGTRWHSDGAGTYTIEEIDKEDVGTTVTVHLKPVDSEDGLHDYTAEYTVRSIVKKYSDFVAYPIKMDIERQEYDKDDEGKQIDGTEKTVVESETLNSMKAIWLRDKDDITEEEYHEFYKHISHDWNDSMDVITAKIEGTLEYRLLAFIPSVQPFDLFHRDSRRGLNLYVKRVFIMDDCKELMPEYLRFIRGVVDSEDLSLNISREMLQQDRQIQRMRKGIVNKVLSALKEMNEKDNEKYIKFWAQFGRVLKEGLFQDNENRDALLDLLLCQSTNSKDELTSLQGYLDRAKDSQEVIYYMSGESREAVENSPHIEAFLDKGYEVLILTEPVDEVWLQSVFEYKGKKLQSVGKGAVDLDSDEEEKAKKKERKKKEKQFSSLMECLKSKLGEYVKEVRLSNRLTTSVACLVGDQQDMTPQMEQLMKAMQQDVPVVKRILELNPNHPLLDKLQECFDKDQNDPALDDYANLVYGQAVLAEGGQLPNPAAFSKLVANLMEKSL